jgi:hypothetical protein
MVNVLALEPGENITAAVPVPCSLTRSSYCTMATVRVAKIKRMASVRIRFRSAFWRDCHLTG